MGVNGASREHHYGEQDRQVHKALDIFAALSKLNLGHFNVFKHMIIALCEFTAFNCYNNRCWCNRKGKNKSEEVLQRLYWYIVHIYTHTHMYIELKKTNCSHSLTKQWLKLLKQFIVHFWTYSVSFTDACLFSSPTSSHILPASSLFLLLLHPLCPPISNLLPACRSSRHRRSS